MIFVGLSSRVSIDEKDWEWQHGKNFCTVACLYWDISESCLKMRDGVSYNNESKCIESCCLTFIPAICRSCAALPGSFLFLLMGTGGTDTVRTGTGQQADWAICSAIQAVIWHGEENAQIMSMAWSVTKYDVFRRDFTPQQKLWRSGSCPNALNWGGRPYTHHLCKAAAQVWVRSGHQGG